MLIHKRTRDTGLLMWRLCTLSISTSSSSSPCRRPPCRRPGVLGVLVIFWTTSMTRWPRPLLPFVKEVSLAVASVHTGSRAPGGGGDRQQTQTVPCSRASACLPPSSASQRTCMTKLAHPAASGPTAPTVPTARLTGSAPGRALHPSWTAPGSAPAAGATTPGGVSVEVL